MVVLMMHAFDYGKRREVYCMLILLDSGTSNDSVTSTTVHAWKPA